MYDVINLSDLLFPPFLWHQSSSSFFRNFYYTCILNNKYLILNILLHCSTVATKKNQKKTIQVRQLGSKWGGMLFAMTLANLRTMTFSAKTCSLVRSGIAASGLLSCLLVLILAAAFAFKDEDARRLPTVINTILNAA